MEPGVLSRWNIRDYRVSDLPVQGSPERSLERYVIESGSRYILERISWQKRDRKEAQAGILEDLRSRGLPVEHYIRADEGTYVVETGRGAWMLKEYVDGNLLKRPNFLKDAWRGSIAADFLSSMRKAAIISPAAPDMPAFIKGMMRRVERRRPDVFRALKEPYETVKPLLREWKELPEVFSHGDFHPMNIIWGNEGINAVIDWEFMGIRPEAYDIALMLGCLGIEDADGLFSPFAETFISESARHISERSLLTLPEMLLVTRFAWMDEWIRNTDDGMISTEFDYMQAISGSIEKIRIYFRGLAMEE